MAVATKAAPLENWRSPGVVKVSPLGGIEWAKNYGTDSHEDAPEMVLAPSGGFVGVFKRNFTGTRAFHADSLGYFGPCSTISFGVQTSVQAIQVANATYTYAPFPGGIGNNQVFTYATSTVIENVCTENGSVGVPFCDPANPNSTGLPTVLTGNHRHRLG